MKKYLVSLTIVGLTALMSLASMAFAPERGVTKFHAEGGICLASKPTPVGGIRIPFGGVVFAPCCRSTILSVANRSGKM